MQTSDLNVNNTESDHATAIFRQFQDAIFSREHTSVKTSTKIIIDLLQWQEIATLSLPRKVAIASFISTTFYGHFCIGANDIARNRSRVIFCRACVDILRRWTCCRRLNEVLNNSQCFVGKQIIMLKLGKNSGYVGYKCPTFLWVRHEWYEENRPEICPKTFLHDCVTKMWKVKCYFWVLFGGVAVFFCRLWWKIIIEETLLHLFGFSWTCLNTTSD